MNKLLEKVIISNVLSALHEGSPVGDKARQLGLNYIGFGRYESPDGVTYKSNGRELIPMEKGKSKKKSSDQSGQQMNFYQIFANKINAFSKQNKEPKSILEMLISLLPKDEQYGNKEMLEKILNGVIPYLNETVIKLLNNKSFRIKLKEKFLQQFSDMNSKDNPINIPSTDINKM